MLKRHFERLLLSPKDLSPSSSDLVVIGAFNPGVIEVDDGVVLLVRVAQRPRERRVGFTPLPRWERGSVVVEWVPDDELEPLDSRVVRRRSDGTLRLTFTSHLQVLRSRDGRSIESEGTRLLPEAEGEEFGVEDPRITRIDGRFYITYVCVSRHGAATALAVTDDFASFQRQGVIFYPENKDVVLFPEQIDGQYVALHRPTTAHAFCPPAMWLARSDDLVHWGSHQPLAGGSADWESDRVGAGSPPIRTDRGWLEIYHASRRSNVAGQVGTYAAGAMLLDLQNPSREIARGAEPILLPTANFEQQGFVPNVVFPTGVVQRGDMLQIFYGAADTHTGVVELSLGELLAEVL
jgi:predicted GH43/DUF377 family glycosyl hydrolase